MYYALVIIALQLSIAMGAESPNHLVACTDADRSIFSSLHSSGSDVFYITCVETVFKSRGNVTVSDFNQCLRDNDVQQFSAHCINCQIQDIESNLNCQNVCLVSPNNVTCTTCIQNVDRHGPSDQCLGYSKSAALMVLEPFVTFLIILAISISL